MIANDGVWDVVRPFGRFLIRRSTIQDTQLLSLDFGGAESIWAAVPDKSAFLGDNISVLRCLAPQRRDIVLPSAEYADPDFDPNTKVAFPRWRRVALSPDGRHALLGLELLVLDRRDRVVKEVIPYFGALEAACFAGPLHAWCFAAAQIPYPYAFYNGHRQCAAELWGLETGQRQVRLLTGRFDVYSFVFRPGGRHFALGWQDRIELRDVTNGNVIRVLDKLPGQVAFSHNGQRLLAVDAAAGVRLFEVETGKQLSKWKVTKGTWGSFAVSPDGRQAASGDEDGTLRLWDADTGRELAHWRAHEAAVTALAFHPDGTTLVSGGGDGTVKLWNLPFIRKELAALGLDWRQGDE